MVFLEALRHMDIEQTIQGHNEMHRQRCDARDPNPADVPKGAPEKGRCPNMAGGLGICSDIMRYNDGMDILYNQKYESTAINMFFVRQKCGLAQDCHLSSENDGKQLSKSTKHLRRHSYTSYLSSTELMVEPPTAITIL